MTKNRLYKVLAAVATTSALTLAFLAASVRPMRAQAPHNAAALTQTIDNPYKQEGHTYWKHPDYESVIDLWKDSTGIHFRVHSLNPDNPKVKEMVAGSVSKKIEHLTQADYEKAASYVAQLVDMKEGKNGRWTGKIYVATRKEHFGIDIQLPHGNEKNLKVRGYIIEGWKKYLTLGNPGNVVGYTLNFSPVENPPARGVTRNPPPSRAIPLPVQAAPRVP